MAVTFTSLHLPNGNSGLHHRSPISSGNLWVKGIYDLKTWKPSEAICISVTTLKFTSLLFPHLFNIIPNFGTAGHCVTFLWSELSYSKDTARQLAYCRICLYMVLLQYLLPYKEANSTDVPVERRIRDGFRSYIFNTKSLTWSRNLPPKPFRREQKIWSETAWLIGWCVLGMRYWKQSWSNTPGKEKV